MQPNDNDVVEIDLLELGRAILKKWWVVLLFAVFAAGAAAVVSYQFMTPVYKAETSLFLGKEKDAIGSITLSDLQIGNQLVTDYTQIIKSKLCTREVIKNLNLNLSVGEFQSRVNVTTIKDSRLFKISFESTEPQMAADVANAMAQVIIQKAAEIIEVKNVKVVDMADVPTSPERPSSKKNIAMAGALGFALAVGLIILLEMMDQTFKKSEDVERQLGINPIGLIPRFAGEKRKKSRNWKGKKTEVEEDTFKPGILSQNLITQYDPRSAAAEAYRTLRTNLAYSSIDRNIKTIVITSPGVEDGKSTSACNLAISLAQNGQNVLLVDADLRKPKIRRYFGLAEDKGLTDILAGKGEAESYISRVKEIKNLDILASGAVPPNPTELLGTHKMQALLESFIKKYDMVIIDTPPVGQLTDAAILGAQADGVLLVVSAGETKIELAKRAKKGLEDVSARVLGGVLVKMQRQGSDRYYYYYSEKSVQG